MFVLINYQEFIISIFIINLGSNGLNICKHSSISKSIDSGSLKSINDLNITKISFILVVFYIIMFRILFPLSCVYDFLLLCSLSNPMGGTYTTCSVRTPTPETFTRLFWEYQALLTKVMLLFSNYIMSFTKWHDRMYNFF